MGIAIAFVIIGSIICKVPMFGVYGTYIGGTVMLMSILALGIEADEIINIYKAKLKRY